MLRSRFLFWWVGLAAVVAGACDGKTVSTSGLASCSSSLDCTGGAVCAFDHCRQACKSSGDCLAGNWCVTTESQTACVPRDAACNQQQDCPPPLLCATDHRCRNACARDSDCNTHDTSGRECVDDENGVGVCASSGEADSGSLQVQPAPGGDSTPVEPPFGLDDPSMPSGGTSLLPGGTGAGGKAGVGGKSGSGGKASGGSGGKSSGGGAYMGGSSGSTGVGGNAGNGGKAGSGGSAGGPGGPSVCDGKTRLLADGYIDNFETTQRFAGWYAFSDTQPPNMPLPMRVSGGASLTAFAAQFGATGVLSSKNQGFGAGFGFGLIDPSLETCVDISMFDGLSFWIKGSAPASVLKLELVTPETQPTNSQPVGDCLPAQACAYAHPATDISVSAIWQHHVVPFNQLKSIVNWSGARILGFLWITDGPAYDVQLDEVEFYSDSAPPGPVFPPGEGGAGGAQ